MPVKTGSPSRATFMTTMPAFALQIVITQVAPYSDNRISSRLEDR
jgi:hypothetical protein